MADDRTMTRVARWLRDRYEAELLACLPVADAEGRRPVLDFPHPVNRSPLWRLMRPWMCAGAATFAGVMLTSIPVPPYVDPVDYWIERAAWGGLAAFMLGAVVYAKTFPFISRRAYRRYRDLRWRGTRALDATIAEALDRARTPKRLIPAPGERADG